MGRPKAPRVGASELNPSDRFMLALSARGETARVSQTGALRIDGVKATLTKAEAEDLVSRGLALWTEGGCLACTDAGRMWAARQGKGDAGYRAQHGELTTAEGLEPARDLAESPLLWLHRRKGADGKPMIGDAMFAAGERLRSDFTLGQMNPRVTLNWSPAVQGSRSPEGFEPGESALAARQRVRRALDKVGPELSGVLIDVCCFLKRLEEVERDRRWPVRSAKVILTLALQRLAGHYGYSDVAEGQLRRAS